MAVKVIIPKQGLGMTEGTITKWLFKEGEKVEEGKALFEMETDKLTIEINAPATGILLKIIHDAGDTVPITKIIGIIGEPGEDYSSVLDGENVQESGNSETDNKIHEPGKNEIEGTGISNRVQEEKVFITPRARMSAAEKNINYSEITGSGPEGLIIEKDIDSFIQNVKSIPKATPVARKIAEKNSIDLSRVSGSGYDGRIMKDDVEKFSAGIDNSHSAREEIIPLNGMRKIIARNMMDSIQNMAQANHRMKVDMSEAVKVREMYKKEGLKISYNDIFVRAVSKALLEYRAMNSSLIDNKIILKNYVNMGLAVALDNGLIVPNIKNSHLMSLQQISTASAEAISKAQNGGLTSEDYSGGTFTITNLGMFDIDEFTAIINPPESGILALGKIVKTPIVENDTVVIKPVMTMSLTYDHRIVDGAAAAQFLQYIKKLLMNPYLML